MALTTKQLYQKRSRRATRRIQLRKRRRYLLRRYGNIVGARVYAFERSNQQLQKSKTGRRSFKVYAKTPKELRAEMTQTDRYGKSPVQHYMKCIQTTGDVHREQRAERRRVSGLLQ